jgi:hypothetical protein
MPSKAVAVLPRALGAQSSALSHVDPAGRAIKLCGDVRQGWTLQRTLCIPRRIETCLITHRVHGGASAGVDKGHRSEASVDEHNNTAAAVTAELPLIFVA